MSFDDDDFVETIEAEVNFIDDHVKSLKEVGKKCLDNFFQNKQMHYGGNISRAAINSSKTMNRLLNTDIIGGVDRAYLSLSLGRFSRKKNNNGLRDDIQLVIDTLNECSELRIPKCFRGGILLLNIEWCHGIKIA